MTMSIALAKDVSATYTRVIWRRLVSPPLFRDFATEILGTFGLEISNPEDTGSSVNELIRLLKSRSILLILDNFESVLNIDTPNLADEYVRLLIEQADSGTSSCIAITTRILPASLSRLIATTPCVRVLKLGGIPEKESRQLASEYGPISGPEDEWATVWRAYGGNPLAIQLVARQIHEVYAGNLHAFLKNADFAIDDIEQLLTWHITQLTPDEAETLTWMAIERLPISAIQLAQRRFSVGHSGGNADVFEGLNRKIPLEHSTNGFALQPVILEHVTRRHAADVAGAVSTGASNGYLDRFPVMLATADETTRRAHEMLILDLAIHNLGSEAKAAVAKLLSERRGSAIPRSYASGSLINIAGRTNLSLNGYTLSGHIRQADLTSVNLRNVNASACTFSECRIHDTFGTVMSIALDEDEQYMWTGGTDGNLVQWNLMDGHQSKALHASEKWLRSVQVSPRGTQVVTCGDDSEIRVWNHTSATPRQLPSLPHVARGMALGFTNPCRPVMRRPVHRVRLR